MAIYKTKDGLDYLVPGIGHTVNGQITTDQIIENPRFEEVQEAQPAQAAAPAPVPGQVQVPSAQQPAPVAAAQPAVVAAAPTNQQEIK